MGRGIGNRQKKSVIPRRVWVERKPEKPNSRVPVPNSSSKSRVLNPRKPGVTRLKN